jgi:4-hydroxybenzoate polyprenyltransferase
MYRIEIGVSKKSGMPCVSVPQESVWSLVEYLAFRRVQADFSYEEEGFLVVFSHLSVASAQQILNDWATYELDMTEVPTDSALGVRAEETLSV